MCDYERIMARCKKRHWNECIESYMKAKKEGKPVDKIVNSAIELGCIPRSVESNPTVVEAAMVKGAVEYTQKQCEWNKYINQYASITSTSAITDADKQKRGENIQSIIQKAIESDCVPYSIENDTSQNIEEAMKKATTRSVAGHRSKFNGVIVERVSQNG